MFVELTFPEKFVPRASLRVRDSILCGFVAVLAHIGAGLAAAAPVNVYLTYGDDTSRGIVVNYHLEQRLRNAPDPIVCFDTVPRGGNAGAYAHKTTGSKWEMPELPVYRTLNMVVLSGLEPGTVYYFVAGDDENGYTKERSFRTVPDGDEALRFVTGGDMGVTPLTTRLLTEAGKHSPLFCAMGGDLPYVNGQLWRYETWDRWFSNYDDHLRTPEGHMVPMFVAIGNHETNDLPSDEPLIKAPFFTAYFSMPQSGGSTYFAKRFGASVLFVVLDTGHVVSAEGEQTAWLADTLSSENALYKFGMYHVPLYPSHRAYDHPESNAGRVHWEPYFSAFGLTAAFENHDHKLKRTKRMSNGVEDEDGVLYLGDGCFGVEPRPIPPDDVRPYLETVQAVGHFWIVDVSVDEVHYRAIGDRGQLLDECRQRPRPVVPALAPAVP